MAERVLGQACLEALLAYDMLTPEMPGLGGERDTTALCGRLQTSEC